MGWLAFSLGPGAAGCEAKRVHRGDAHAAGGMPAISWGKPAGGTRESESGVCGARRLCAFKETRVHPRVVDETAPRAGGLEDGDGFPLAWHKCRINGYIRLLGRR